MAPAPSALCDRPPQPTHVPAFQGDPDVRPTSMSTGTASTFKTATTFWSRPPARASGGDGWSRNVLGKHEGAAPRHRLALGRLRKELEPRRTRSVNIRSRLRADPQ